MEDFVTETERDLVVHSKEADQEEKEEQTLEKTKEVEDDEDKLEEANGFISHLISNLVSPKAGGSKSENNPFGGGDGFGGGNCGGGGGGGGGGVINNLISNMFHPSEGEEAEKVGAIDNIVSHLPTPLADDMAPATDEASILIHSIIHD